MMKNVALTELFGIFFTFFLGSFFHFTYALSGNHPIVALFSAVNESTWEHMKLLFFPYFLFTFLEFVWFKGEFSNLFTAKALGVIAGLMMIPLLFYGYTFLLGRHYAVLDILVFVVSVIVAYGVSFIFMEKRFADREKIGAGLLVCIALLFFIFTFFPPECFLFAPPDSI